MKKNKLIRLLVLGLILALGLWFVKGYLSVDNVAMESSPENLESNKLKHQNEESAKSQQTTFDKITSANRVTENGFIVPQWLGIKYSQALPKEGSFFYFEDLEILDPNTGKTIDKFPLFIWGMMALRAEEGKVMWDISGQGYEFGIIYSYNPEKQQVVRKPNCYMYHSKKALSEYKLVIPAGDGSGVDWEKKVNELEGLAAQGNLYAYNFFLNPSEEQKVFHKYNDGAASFDPVITRLNFYKTLGCKWK